MIDTSKAKWEIDVRTAYAIKWLEENGFDGRITKQWLSRTEIEVTKDGVTDVLRITHNIKNLDMAALMAQFKRNFEMLQKLKRLEK